METTMKRWSEAKAAIPMRLSREEYKTQCAAWGVEAHPDADLGDYGDQYGEYWGIPYDAETDEEVAYLGDGSTAEQCRRNGVERLLRQRRFFALERERETAREGSASGTTSGPAGATPAERPAIEGQLWEECPRCGREPVYMPSHLCTGCLGIESGTRGDGPAV